MVERICSTCQAGNALDDRYCGKCGAPLERQLPARRGETAMVVAGKQLPITWKQFGRTVALSAAAIVAEAGVAWLRRRMDQPGTPAPLAKPTQTTALAPRQQTTPNPGSKVVTIVSQRVIEVTRGDDGSKVIERHFWRRTEE